MGYKNVCINCKRVESLGTDHSTFRAGDCPQCSTPMYFVNQKFRPPRANDEKAWAVSAYLISQGFTYCTIRDKTGMPVEYPGTMKSAEEFVQAHRAQAAVQQTRRRHEIEQRIAELRQQPENTSRNKMIRELSLQLAAFC